MKRASVWLRLAASGLFVATGGRAQELPRNLSIFQRSVAAPTHAFELGVRAGYDQGVGALDGEPSHHVQDVASVGLGGNFEAGFRLSPRLSIGAYGTGSGYSAVAPSESVRTFAGGVAATWHFRPYRSLDPWASLGAGYRVFWDARTNEGTTTRQAVQLVRIGIGVDYRFSPEFAVGPFVGGDLSFFFREAPSGGPSMPVKGALSSFVSAGISARFDIVGQAVYPAVGVAAR